MAKTPLLFLCILILLASNSITQSHSQQDEFFFSGFNEAATNITLNGGAVIEHKGTIRLTNDTERVLGHAFYSTPIKFKNNKNTKVFSFSTSFAFAIIPQYPKLGGHGFAFTISPSNKLSNGYPSQYLGLLNPHDLGNFSNHLFAVEFDTVQDFEFNDINDNHVGINLNNMVSNKSVKACFFTDGLVQDLNLKSGSVIQAWIDYNSSMNHLEVRLSPTSSKPSSPILSYKGYSLAHTIYLVGASKSMVVCGRRPIEAKALPEELVLVDWVWDRWRVGEVMEVVDKKLGGVYDEVEVLLVVKVGLLCSDELPDRRPTMRQVVRYLEGEVKLPEIDKKAGFLYQRSEFFERVNTWSSAGDDVESAFASSLQLSGGR
ncbi:hypothetical protein TSUD_151860 [Trifolium subterraneum]|uniref:Legume lectin domain-containing protein n=1 Tax=Trifolium subterraneum TaxID=3900 RepID=A0A2Z6N8R6_TRISU|nr:hypothetical protein TSUD_151860 [Trifolium subterraneum]